MTTFRTTPAPRNGCGFCIGTRSGQFASGRILNLHYREKRMNVEEIKEGTEHAHHKGEKKIGLTMAIVAVMLAMATLLGHRAHTEEVILQGERNTQWVNFDTKRMQRIVHEDFAALSAAL